MRYHLVGADYDSVMVKHVRFPSAVNHPHGWHKDLADQGKVRSYEVEMQWYRHQAGETDQNCRIPRCYATETIGEEHLIVLEDLDAAGFPLRKSVIELTDVQRCLRWLAHFHARFMGEKPTALWPAGCYWHLATRPDEFAAVEDDALHEAAPILDSILSNARFQTIVHGDAKPANFCFARNDGFVNGASGVAALDFQYVGGGCGMKDVAFFLSSCLNEQQHDLHEAKLIDDYFNDLRSALGLYGKEIDAAVLESEWRDLYPAAQTDFYRFLVGWMPTHWKINDYNKQVAKAVLKRL